MCNGELDGTPFLLTPVLASRPVLGEALVSTGLALQGTGLVDADGLVGRPHLVPSRLPKLSCGLTCVIGVDGGHEWLATKVGAFSLSPESKFSVDACKTLSHLWTVDNWALAARACVKVSVFLETTTSLLLVPCTTASGNAILCPKGL